MNVYINVNRVAVSVKILKRKKKHVYTYNPVTVCSHCLAVMCIYVIYQCLSWGWDQPKIRASKARKQPIQAIDGELLSILSHIVSEKIQSVLRKEQRWTHSLRCCQCLATQVCMKHYVK